MKLARLAFRLSVVAAACTLAGALPACADENDPRTWVKRLDDPGQRPAAIERLGRFFDDAMKKASGDREDPSVSGLVDKIAPPLTKTYTSAPLDEKTRADLMKELRDLRDARTAPALAKALGECEAGKNDDETRYAAQAVSGLAAANKPVDPSVADALWSCFDELQVHAVKSSNLPRDLHDALIAARSPTYAPKAIAKLSAPIDAPAQGPDGTKDLEFWQATAAEALGSLQLADGVKPLVTALLTPSKRSLRGAVNRALLQMPKESEPALIAALNAQDPDLAKLKDEMAPSKEYVAVLAESLSSLSRPSGRDAVIGALASAGDDDDRVALAASLVHWPEDPRILPMYLDAYRKVSPAYRVKRLGDALGRATLLAAASRLYDPTLVEWMLREAAGKAGKAGKEEGVADEMRRSGLRAAIESMTPAQMKMVGDAVAKYGTPPEQEMLKVASEVLTKCNTDASCYVAALDEPAPGGDARWGRPAKAAYMAVVFGHASPDVRGALLARVEKVRGPGARVGLVDAIDRLSPLGDVQAAAALEKVVAADRAPGERAGVDEATLAAEAEVSLVALRLRARAL